MKAIITLLTIALFASANAQDAKVETNVQPTIVTGVSEITTTADKTAEFTFEINTEATEAGFELARLYKSKNYLIKKELTFRTKAHRSKLA